MNETKLVEKLVNGNTPQPLENLNNLAEVFVVKYKQGPIMKWVNIRAKDLSDAYIQASKYLRHIESRDNHRVVMVGKPEPFAINVDDEIEAWNNKNGPQKMNSGVDATSMPNSIISP